MAALLVANQWGGVAVAVTSAAHWPGCMVMSSRTPEGYVVLGRGSPRGLKTLGDPLEARVTEQRPADKM